MNPDSSLSTAPLGPSPQPWAEAHPGVVGLGTLILLHGLLVLGPLQGVTAMKGTAEVLFIGVVQLWYVLPLCLVFHTAGWRRTLRVFAFGALATFILNLVACAALVGMISSI
jgi:hypothetical protein